MHFLQTELPLSAPTHVSGRFDDGNGPSQDKLEVANLSVFCPLAVRVELAGWLITASSPD